MVRIRSIKRGDKLRGRRVVEEDGLMALPKKTPLGPVRGKENVSHTVVTEVDAQRKQGGIQLGEESPSWRRRLIAL